MFHFDVRSFYSKPVNKDPSQTIRQIPASRSKVTKKVQSEESPSSSSYSWPAGSAKKWIIGSILLGGLFVFFSWLDSIRERFYVFDPESLHTLAKDAIAASPSPNDTYAIINYIVSHLQEEYPSSLVSLNTNTSEWTFSNSGGAMGAFYVIHASITEYLMIFGTPLGTEGHTGIHTADDYFNVLVGEQWAFSPPNLEKEVYGPGDVHFLPRGQMKQYKMHEGCFAMEYARGWIPLMMPFGLLDIFSSTLDYKSLFDMLRISAREIVRNLLLFKI
ncbi:C-8 sterol isomerase [Abortiporus biennis]